MKTSIVLGMGFGDEGKGLTVSSLVAQSESPIVVRFSGGQQAGHTVVFNGYRHVFSNFGSGTLQGAPTYWSKYCTFCPVAALEEAQALKSFKPKLYVDYLCPVTTPFDVIANRSRDLSNGTVGAGVGTTLQRQEDHYKLFVQDLFYPRVLRAKLNNIALYYKTTNREMMDSFIYHCKRVTESEWFLPCHSINDIEETPDHRIYEGSQGILLDKDFGFFPNVTRSNTCSKNALQLISECPHSSPPEIYYITRAYQTRHGRGFMSNEHFVHIRNNENETNVPHEFQGKFRTGLLDLELLNYALDCDDNFSHGLKKNLVITCLDQTDDTIQLLDERIIEPHELSPLLNFKMETTFGSYGDSIATFLRIVKPTI